GLRHLEHDRYGARRDGGQARGTRRQAASRAARQGAGQTRHPDDRTLRGPLDARVPERTAYVDALHLLGRRELSVKQLRERLRDREHAPEDIDRAVTMLLDNRAL